MAPRRTMIALIINIVTGRAIAILGILISTPLSSTVYRLSFATSYQLPPRLLSLIRVHSGRVATAAASRSAASATGGATASSAPPTLARQHNAIARAQRACAGCDDA